MSNHFPPFFARFEDLIEFPFLLLCKHPSSAKTRPFWRVGLPQGKRAEEDEGRFNRFYPFGMAPSQKTLRKRVFSFSSPTTKNPVPLV
jgi:hypothetical protein